MGIQLRKVTKSDWDFVLELRNNDFQYFYEQNAPIPKKSHYKYMENHVDDTNFHQWIISLNSDNVGYVRILNEDVGIMIKKEFQGKGIATKALEILEREAVSLGIKKLVALVHPENLNSERIFKKNGYNLKLYKLEKVLT